MKPKLLMTVAVVFGLMSTGAAADPPSTTLNTLEVQRLVSSGGPADHARLRDHFIALAGSYQREADRNATRATGFIGNPNHPPSVGTRDHFVGLAEQHRGRALTTRELAAHHGRLAAGQRSTPPAGSSRFESGEGARLPTEIEMHTLAASARTPGDHFALEEYFVDRAADQRAIVERHQAMASAHRVTSARRTPSADPAVHCDRLVDAARKAETDALGRALVHRQLATIG